MLQVTPWSAMQPLERLAGVLAAAIGVMQHRFGLASPPDGHDQRIGHQLRRHRRLHRPAHHPAGDTDQAPRRDIQPAFGRPEIREVGDPLAGW